VHQGQSSEVFSQRSGKCAEESWEIRNQYLFRPLVFGILYSSSVFRKSKIILGLAHRGLYEFSSILQNLVFCQSLHPTALV